jgi:hypothetical protein
MLIEHSRYDFEDVRGVIRTFAGCSLFDRFEFQERLQELHNLLAKLAEENEGAETEKLFEDNRYFRFLVIKVLDLNGIDPAWLTWPMAESMLFGRVEIDEETGQPTVLPPWLVEVNRLKPRDSDRPPSLDDEPPTLAHLIASISHSTGSIESAIKAAKELPTDFLLDIIEARAEQLKPPEKDFTKTKSFKAVKKQMEEQLRQAALSGESSPFTRISADHFK